MENDLKGSLTYASYIQSALFPEPEILNSFFLQNFVFYKQKDIVGGDFYWTHTIGDKLIVVVGDCTGHGVPGALLTTISILLLNKVVAKDKCTDPAIILHLLNKNFFRTFKQKNNKINDGLEASVCVFDSKKLVFAGARRNVFIKRNNEIIELKGNNLDIGGSESEKKIFTKHYHKLKQGDCIYIYTDGITDQIGGLNDKKLMKKNFKNILETFSDEDMTQQQKTISDYLLQWMKSEELQTDDMLLVGIKI